jgi:prevent-host-death family protein
MEVCMIAKVSAVHLRQNLGDILNKISYTHQPIIIERAGKGMAVLIDIDTYNQQMGLRSNEKKKKSFEQFLSNIQVDLKHFKFKRDEANER